MTRSIPIDPTLMPYIRYLFGSNRVEYRPKNPQSTLIFSYFRRKTTHDEDMLKSPGSENVIQVVMTREMIKKGETYICPKSVKFLEKYLLEELRDEVTQLACKRMLCKMKQSDAIKSALVTFDLDESVLPYSTAQKRIQRHLETVQNAEIE